MHRASQACHTQRQICAQETIRKLIQRWLDSYSFRLSTLAELYKLLLVYGHLSCQGLLRQEEPWEKDPTDVWKSSASMALFVLAREYTML